MVDQPGPQDRSLMRCHTATLTRGKTAIDSLMDSVSGAYQVTTQASTYVVDLDRMVIRRTPRTHYEGGSLLRRDEELVMLVELLECSVGKRMELLLNLHVYGVPGTARFSTTVVAIDPIASPGRPLE